jgi:hypothetical protein
MELLSELAPAHGRYRPARPATGLAGWLDWAADRWPSLADG